MTPRLIEDLPKHISEGLDRRHPTYRWKLDAIMADTSSHGVWKQLASWEGEKAYQSATTARRSLRARFGPSPLILGFEFATKKSSLHPTNEPGVMVPGGGMWYLAVRYTPALIVDDAYELWVLAEQKKKAESNAELRVKRAVARGEEVTVVAWPERVEAAVTPVRDLMAELEESLAHLKSVPVAPPAPDPEYPREEP